MVHKNSFHKICGYFNDLKKVSSNFVDTFYDLKKVSPKFVDTFNDLKSVSSKYK